MLHPDTERCVGITAHILNRAIDSDNLVHTMRFNKNEPLVFDWRSLMDGRAGKWGKLEFLKWLPKKTANAMHEFWSHHFLSFPEKDFPRLPDDRRGIRNLHEKLPMSVVNQLLEKLVLQRRGQDSGHYRFSKCLYIAHKLYDGKQHVHSQPLPKQKYFGYV